MGSTVVDIFASSPNKSERYYCGVAASCSKPDTAYCGKPGPGIRIPCVCVNHNYDLEWDWDLTFKDRGYTYATWCAYEHQESCPFNPWSGEFPCHANTPHGTVVTFVQSS